MEPQAEHFREAAFGDARSSSVCLPQAVPSIYRLNSGREAPGAASQGSPAVNVIHV